MTVIFPEGSINPDKASISSKSTIDLGVYESDVSASSYTQSIKLNYTSDGIIVQIPDDIDFLEGGYRYYTPIYVEKLNYEVWKDTVNKTFKELN